MIILSLHQHITPYSTSLPLPPPHIMWMLSWRIGVGDGSSESTWKRRGLRERSRHCSSPRGLPTRAKEPAGCHRMREMGDYVREQGSREREREEREYRLTSHIYRSVNENKIGYSQRKPWFS